MSAEPYATRMRKAWQRCEEFNAAVQTGGAVIYRDQSGGTRATKTRSLAWALPSGQPMVMVVGVVEGVHLDHVEVPL